MNVTRILPAIAAVITLASPGCGSRRYPVSGMVLQIDRGERTMVVSHERIPGYMDPMAMPFRVRDAASLDLLQPGMRVEFTLVVNKQESWAERVRLASGARIEPDLERAAPAPSISVGLGQPVPDFELTDQQGRPVKLSQFAGKVVAVTFIYTRCPLPDVCPRLSSNFARMQERFGAQLGRDLVLFSVTFRTRAVTSISSSQPIGRYHSYRCPPCNALRRGTSRSLNRSTPCASPRRKIM